MGKKILGERSLSFYSKFQTSPYLKRSQGLAGACKGLRSWSSHWAAKVTCCALCARSKACIWLDIPEATCGERVLQRFGHRTLPPEDKSLEASSLRMMRFCFCMFNLMKHVNLHCVASISLPSIWIRKFFEPGHQWLCTTLWASDGGAVGGSGGETNQVNRTIQLLIRKLYDAILIHSSTNNHTQICTHNTHIHELILYLYLHFMHSIYPHYPILSHNRYTKLFKVDSFENIQGWGLCALARERWWRPWGGLKTENFFVCLSWMMRNHVQYDIDMWCI